ncbi:MAG: peptidoglycan editing factor PgeF [Pseudomonadota bacterium]
MLPCFKSKLLNQIPHVTHGFFTRNGGVSCGQYATLNTLERKTDNPQHVAENRRRIVETLGGGTLQFNNQTHSTIVHHVTKKYLQDGDAQITQTPGLLIGVQTADCMPILIAHKTQKIVAAVHAGWKGTLTGVIQATLDELKKMCTLDELVCVVGPCIAPLYLEVKEDVLSFLPQPPKRPLIFGEHLDIHWHLDLRTMATQIFQDYGIVHIDHIDEDTYSQPDKFFSYRRATHKKEQDFGGQASLIGLF